MTNWKKVLLKVFGFGAGFGIGVALLIATFTWWSARPRGWNARAVTAKASGVTFIDKLDDNLQVRFRYSLTNNTNVEYVLPSPEGDAAFMRVLPDSKSLDRLYSFAWDSSLRIPPKQSVVVTFDTVWAFGSHKPKTSAPDANGFAFELEPRDTFDTRFVQDRLKDIDGFVFFDYGAKYKVELPRDAEHIDREDLKHSF